MTIGEILRKKLAAVCLFGALVLAAVSSPAAEQAGGQGPADDIEIGKDVVERALPGYTMDLKELAVRAECRIKKIDARLTPADYVRAARDRIAKGDTLFTNGDKNGAAQAWQEALAITADPEIQKAVEERAAKLQEPPPAATPAPEKAAETPVPGAAQPENPAPAAQKEAPAAPAKEVSSPKALHESWYHEPAEEKTPEPEKTALGVALDRRQ